MARGDGFLATALLSIVGGLGFAHHLASKNGEAMRAQRLGITQEIFTYADANNDYLLQTTERSSFFEKHSVFLPKNSPKDRYAQVQNSTPWTISEFRKYCDFVTNKDLEIVVNSMR